MAIATKIFQDIYLNDSVNFYCGLFWFYRIGLLFILHLQ